MTTDTAREALLSRARRFIERTSQEDPAAIREAVLQGQNQLNAAIVGLSPEQATFKPADDVWSVLEVLAHVVTAKGGVARVCERLGRGETVAGHGPEGERQDGITRTSFASLDEARDALGVAHSELLAFVDERLANAKLDTRYNHFIFGDLNCRGWAAFQRVHDADHSLQIEQVKATPGYPA
jgi:DinB superfamily